MSESNNIFNDIMNFTSEENTSVTVIEPSVELKTELQEDFDDARNNLKEIAEISRMAMNDMARLASQLQDPKGYNVLATLIASSVMSQKAVVELHKNKQEGKDPNELPPRVENTNYLVLTTDQLQLKLEEAAAKAAESRKQLGSIHDNE